MFYVGEPHFSVFTQKVSYQRASENNPGSRQRLRNFRSLNDLQNSLAAMHAKAPTSVRAKVSASYESLKYYRELGCYKFLIQASIPLLVDIAKKFDNLIQARCPN